MKKQKLLLSFFLAVLLCGMTFALASDVQITAKGIGTISSISNTKLTIPAAKYEVWYEGDVDDWDDIDEYDLDDFYDYEAEYGEKVVAVRMNQAGNLYIEHNYEKAVDVYKDAACRKKVGTISAKGKINFVVGDFTTYYLKFVNADRSDKKVSVSAYYYPIGDQNTKENQWCDGSNDGKRKSYYRMEVSKTGIATIRCDVKSGSSNPKIILYDAQKNKVKSKSLNSANFPVRKGTYYFAVDNGSNGVSVKWKLRSADSENASQAAAQHLKKGTERTMLFSASNSNDRVRWYSIQLKHKQYISIKLDGKASLQLQNASGKTFALRGNQSGEIYDSKKKLTPGTYYLKVIHPEFTEKQKKKQTLMSVAVSWNKIGSYGSTDEFDIDEEGTLLAYKGKSRNVEIPIGVKEIGCKAFYGNKRLVSVTIPNGVKKISDSAFADCINLKSVTIPNSVKKIGWYTFENCTSLEKVKLSKKMKRITSMAFSGCTSLRTVDIPEGSLEKIGQSAFRQCTALKSIVIPEGVTTIEKSAFESCTSLKEVSFPDSVEEIGWYTFAKCTSLEKVKLSKKIKRIPTLAFSECTSLQTVDIPEGDLKEIELSAFAQCTALESIVIPEGVTTIRQNAFASCTSLKEVSFPSTIKEISHSAFYKCDSLPEEDIPK